MDRTWFKRLRDVVKLARLVTNQEDVSHIISIMKRYSKGNYNDIPSLDNHIH